jgi:hypothetical protein
MLPLAPSPCVWGVEPKNISPLLQLTPMESDGQVFLQRGLRGLTPFRFKPSEFFGTTHSSLPSLVVSSVEHGRSVQEPRSSACHLIGAMDRPGPLLQEE